MKILGRVSLSLALMALFVVGSTALAQQSASKQERPKYAIVHMDEVEPAMAEQYEEAMRGWVEAFKQAKMGPDWAWYTSVGDEFTYVFSSPLKSFADLDRQEEFEKQVEKAIGKAKLEELEKKGAPAIRTHHSEITRYVEALSYHPEKSAMTKSIPGFLHIGVHWVKPEMMKQFREVFTRFRDALAKSKHPLGFEAHQVMFGDGSYVIVWAADSAEQFHRDNDFGPALNQALGQEGAKKLYKDWRECLWKYTTFDAQPRPDLSYVPMAQTQ